jgi:phosphoglucomutase
MYEKSKTISHYKIAKIPDVNLSKIGTSSWSGFSVEVIDSIEDYLNLIEKIFNFSDVKTLLKIPHFKSLFDSLYGVTGPYAVKIFAETLGFPHHSCQGEIVSETDVFIGKYCFWMCVRW